MQRPGRPVLPCYTELLRDNWNERFLDVINRLRPEPSTHIRGDHAHLVGFPALHVDHVLFHQKRRLGSRPDCQHVIQFVIGGDDRAVFDGEPAAPMNPEFFLVGQIGILKRLFNVAISDCVFRAFVIGGVGVA